MICSINGKLTPYKEAHLQISDLGLQRGYGIFDYFIANNCYIPFFDDYLDRFFASARLLNLEIPQSREEIKETIKILISENQLSHSGVKLLLTGGYSDDLYTPSTPNFLILNLSLHQHPGTLIGGIKLLLLDYQRFRPEIKTTFYLPSINLLPELKRQGAMEVLFHHNGFVSETTRANFFMIKNGKLITPASGILLGVTRKHVLKIASTIMEIEEREVKLTEIFDADEAFITSTSKHIAPVVAIDGQMIGAGNPGSVTLKLYEAFRKYYDELSIPKS